MEKENLIATINRLLPSVEGEDESLITAAKLRQVLEAVYDAGVADALQNPNVKVTGYGNKIFSTASLPSKPQGYAFTYDADLRKLQIDEIYMFAVGQHLTVVDIYNQVSADVIIEQVNTDESYIIVSENNTLISTTDEGIYIYSDDFPLQYSSNINANNAVVFGNNVFFSPANQPVYFSIGIFTAITKEINGDDSANILYVDDYFNQKYLLKPGANYTLRDEENAVDYPVIFKKASIITYNNGNFYTLLKIELENNTIDFGNSDTWSLITDIIDGSEQFFVLQNGTQSDKRFLICDSNGKATWSSEMYANYFRLQNGTQQAGRYLMCDADGVASWQSLNISQIYATYLRLQNGTQQAGRYLMCDANGVATWATLNIPSQSLSVVSKTASFTLSLGDAEKYMRCDNADKLDVLVPNNSSVSFAIGTSIYLEQKNAGIVTCNAAVGVTLNGGNKTQGLNKIIQLIKVDNNEWNIIGGVI